MYKMIFILLVAVYPAMSQAQVGGLLNKVNSKIKNKTNARVDQKMDQVIDKRFGLLEAKSKSGISSKTEVGNPGDTSGAGKKIYVKYDFVPGEEIVYHNDFGTDLMGELPTGWNSNGNGTVVTLAGLHGNWIGLYQNATYLTDNKAAFTENFTVEFDLVLRRTDPAAPFPEFTWGVLSSGSSEPDHNDLLKNYMAHFATEMNIQPAENSYEKIHLQTYEQNASYLKTDRKNPGTLLKQFNKVIHVAMQVQKERLRVWFNEEKLYDLPKAIPPAAAINQLYFSVKRYGGSEEVVGYAISNIKIAKGLPDTRHKLLNEGRFSTTGILFGRNSSSVLPESTGVLKEIADVLQKDPELKIKIIGHTDSDGDEAANLKLSGERAVAVKQYLVNAFHIDAARMSAEGAGEAQPVGDNNTKEGKANNRRVEFVKQ